ncbi:MAG: hypothetical protein ACE5GN_00620 [Waddliaceae bacterium]
MKGQTGTSILPFMDLMFLLIIVFFGLSGFIWIIGPEIDQATAEGVKALQKIENEKTKVKVNERKREKLKRELSALEHELANMRRQSLIDNSKTALEMEAVRLEEERKKSLTREIDELENQLDTIDKLRRKKEVTDVDLEKINLEIERSQAQKAMLTKKLEKLKEILASPSKETYALRSGAPRVNRTREAKDFYSVVLSKGKVIPLIPDYFEGTQYSNGVVVKPKRSGLTFEEVIKPDSPIMKAVLRSEFRKDGRAVLFVNPDSFSAFRKLRDFLIKEHIDVGWDTMEGTTIFISDEEGRSVPSQGR